ncbi:MAG TPA: DMT family transporter, partial [Bacteroidales bacterium]|nr:DMT family transporter [Bacteroidales bacterium]
TILSKKGKLLNTKIFLQGITLGLFLGISYMAQTVGLQYTSTGHSAFITSSAVVVVPFILFFFFKAKIVAIDWISILIVFGGLFLLTYDLETSINKGDIITILSAVSGAMHLVLAGRFIQKSETFPLVSYQFLGTALFSFIAWSVTGAEPVSITLRSGISLVYLGLFGTLFCFFIVVWVQKYLSSLKTVVILSLEPVFAAIFGYFIIHETLNTKELTGTFLILAGVLLHSILKNKKAQVSALKKSSL